ncbi:hypothetical protein CIPAW_15G121400 [Carya illinoinensis]|uniref:Uncharacterized protein n=1 Tax=Carya illinoinensis TaxID=32201 RepID=A0A8T1NE10_CARIL|nr:hypothetical protein CIPAW_15G121400 [Carya illinoinensis]
MSLLSPLLERNASYFEKKERQRERTHYFCTICCRHTSALVLNTFYWPLVLTQAEIKPLGIVEGRTNLSICLRYGRFGRNHTRV